MNDDGQVQPNSSPDPVFHSSEIGSSKAGQKTNYFVNLRRSSAFDRLSQKIDQKRNIEEFEAKKRAEEEAARRAEQEKLNQSEDRFRNHELEVKVPAFVKMGATTPQPTPPQPPRPAQQIVDKPIQAPVIKNKPPRKPLSKSIIYLVAAIAVFAIALILVIWKLIPEKVIVTKQTQVAAPVTETTLLDEVTKKRLEILDLITTDGIESGLKAYDEYINSTTDAKELALIHAWRTLDLYRLYRSEYKDTILSDAYEAEILHPTKGTALLIYWFEREFGDQEKAETYHTTASSRPETEDDDVRSLVEELDEESE